MAISRIRGYTLAELALSISMATIISGAIFVLSRTGFEHSQVSEIKMTIQDSAREGLYKMLQEIRQSAPGRVSISDNERVLTFDIPNSASGVSDSYGVDWNSAHSIQYAIGGINSSQLIRSNLTTATTTVVANQVRDVNFQISDNGNVINVELSVSKVAENGRNVPGDMLKLNGEAVLRNQEVGSPAVPSAEHDGEVADEEEDSDSSNSSSSESDDDNSHGNSENDHSENGNSGGNGNSGNGRNR